MLNQFLLSVGYDAQPDDMSRLFSRAIECSSDFDIIPEMERLSTRTPAPSAADSSDYEDDRHRDFDVGVSEVPAVNESDGALAEDRETVETPAEAVNVLANDVEDVFFDDEQDVQEMAALVADGARQGRQDILVRLFECPICLSLIFPQYRICNSCRNVAICERCVVALHGTCSFCLSSFGDWRNLIMENVATFIYFPCHFSSDGCSALIHGSEWEDHVSECVYNPLRRVFLEEDG